MSLKILSSHAVMEAMNELAPAFERASGQILSFSYDPANVLKQRINAGEGFDIVILSRQVFDELAGQGKLLADTGVDVGRSGLGVSARHGAPKLDIATVESFKRTLLAAKSIVRSKDGTSGIYFEQLLQRLGIGDAMRDKVILGPSGRVAVLVAKAEVDLAVQQICELLPVKGANFVGPFPADLQLYTVFTAGIAAASRQRSEAKAFIDSFTTPAAVARFQAKGLEPIPHNAQ